MNETNIVAIVKEIVALFGTNSRNELSAVITSFIIDFCADPGMVWYVVV